MVTSGNHGDGIQTNQPVNCNLRGFPLDRHLLPYYWSTQVTEYTCKWDIVSRLSQKSPISLAQRRRMEAKLTESDKLLRQKKYQACEELLKSIETLPEVAWRRTRLLYVQTTTLAKKPSKDVLQKTFQRAMDEVDAGLKANENHANCLTWKGICINELALLSGIDERIKRSYDMRNLWQKALDLEPDNDVALQAMGTWCFHVADLSELKRAFAKAFFTNPPRSTYDEALNYLTKSEQLAPVKQIQTQLLIAKCYERLKNKDKTKEYCQKVLAMTDTGYLSEEVGLNLA
ncbi:hypothetical protein CRM22_000987 [Opisthorchis felineus]|uniref:Regulator of microtubule dynamics protein 1 n=1 Tax=Opisthorchis felineus TaxID=147828 RepID=A0A4S2MCM9_OPIFE|nr:hypothetical protein CRM22_000987 [Opisthorchis felineus]